MAGEYYPEYLPIVKSAITRCTLTATMLTQKTLIRNIFRKLYSGHIAMLLLNRKVAQAYYT